MNYKHLILMGLVAVLSACGNDYVLEDYFDLQELPGYVAFNAPGNSVVLDDVVATEDEGMVTVNVEAPTGTLSDITVEYELGGSAVFGEDYNISGATASGGTLVVKARADDVVNRTNEDIEIELLTDGVQDGEKTITITLLSASNAEGNIAVGRGGTDLLKTATVIITDID